MTPHAAATSPPHHGPPGSNGHAVRVPAPTVLLDPVDPPPGRDDALLHRWVDYLTEQWKAQAVFVYEHDAATSARVSALTTQVVELSGQVRDARDEADTATGLALAAAMAAVVAVVMLTRLSRRTHDTPRDAGRATSSGASVIVLDDPAARVRVG